MALPVALNLEGRRVVSVGGGPVSAHRVGIFLEEGAEVTVVAPWLCEDLVDLVITAKIRWIDRDYAGPEDLLGARFVHTATGDPATDARVLADSEDLGTWCVSAGSHRTTAAAVLARAKVDLPDGPVTLAVHASGDPARAVAVRNVLTESLETGSFPCSGFGLGKDSGGWRSSAAVQDMTICSRCAVGNSSRPLMSSSWTVSPRTESWSTCLPPCG